GFIGTICALHSTLPFAFFGVRFALRGGGVVFFERLHLGQFGRRARGIVVAQRRQASSHRVPGPRVLRGQLGGGGGALDVRQKSAVAERLGDGQAVCLTQLAHE